MRRGYARGRARDEAIRAELVPLDPGERPLAVTLGAVLAGALGLANAILFLAGYEISEGREAGAGSTAIFVGVMGAAAVGMWRRSYWAVLAFQAILAISILFGALGLLQAGDARAALVAGSTLVVASALFWFLVRAMARIQATERLERGLGPPE